MIFQHVFDKILRNLLGYYGSKVNRFWRSCGVMWFQRSWNEMQTFKCIYGSCSNHFGFWFVFHLILYLKLIKLIIKNLQEKSQPDAKNFINITGNQVVQSSLQYFTQKSSTLFSKTNKKRWSTLPKRFYLNGHTKGKMKMKTTRHVSVVVYTGSNMFQ